MKTKSKTKLQLTKNYWNYAASTKKKIEILLYQRLELVRSSEKKAKPFCWKESIENLRTPMLKIKNRLIYFAKKTKNKNKKLQRQFKKSGI
ncbi:hypothetical protein BK810_16175 [Listeria monocytogenes]|nr:hypothetical protein BK810_16175 [Listeria monocytogenes]